MQRLSLEKVLAREGHPFRTVKTWTTDAFYRETKRRIACRKAEGCLTVEMEAASLFAVAKFRRVDAGLLLYAGDDVSGRTWDSRDWQGRKDIRERQLELAIAAALEM